jgi:hypothetical protein
MGFDLTTPVFERAKTVHALDRAATVIGAISSTYTVNKNYSQMKYETSARKAFRFESLCTEIWRRL